MKQKSALLGTAIFAITACADATNPTAVAVDSPDAKMIAASATAEIIPGRFIVTLRDDVDPAGVASQHGVSPTYVYRSVLTGFAGAMSDAARAGLLRDARVLRIEPDGIARTQTTQLNPTWGLDRIDQRGRTLDGEFNYTNTGTGVTAYIIDTGIRLTHDEFKTADGSRASSGFDAVDGGSADDCNGHGTHVAGTVGGTTYGVAKGVALVAVRVLDCSGSGSWSGVIKGMDWVTAHHKEATETSPNNTPAVANMSLGGGANTSVDDAVKRMIADGVATAVAAGNGNQGGRAQDACKYSPARVPDAMTIGATTTTDAKTSWSNYGQCVDWFAPGAGIKSAWYNTDAATNTISGTSMATPHVAGVAALYLQTNPGALPAIVRTALYDNTTKGIVSSSKTTNNHLLFTNY